MSEVDPNAFPGGPGDLAEEALRAAQQAVTNLRQDTTPVMASNGGDDAATAALLAASRRSPRHARATSRMRTSVVASSGQATPTFGGGSPGAQPFGLPAFAPLPGRPSQRVSICCRM